MIERAPDVVCREPQRHKPFLSKKHASAIEIRLLVLDERIEFRAMLFKSLAGGLDFGSPLHVAQNGQDLALQPCEFSPLLFRPPTRKFLQEIGDLLDARWPLCLVE
ncbi:MAG: hypothetical protein O2960_08825 [Verrucomicrobia bacterium]|nr:hypothetical protein [Verrucomicrobiota bacterium]